MIVHFLFNLIVNSFLAFFTTFILIQGAIFLFRVKNYRIKSLLYVLPFFKLAVDPFFYNFSSWALMHNVNPLLAETDSRSIMASCSFTESIMPLKLELGFLMNTHETFSLADVLALSFDPFWISAFTLCVAFISLFKLARFFVTIKREKKELARIIAASIPSSRVINERLAERLKHIKVMETKDLSLPCAAKGYILMPLCNDFTDAEYEAIIAHELNHIEWRDGYLRLSVHHMRCIFWWIPCALIANRWEGFQERGCDDSIRRFNLDRLDLAAAMIKAAKGNAPQFRCATPICRENEVKGRIMALTQPFKGDFKAKSAAVFFISFAIVGGRFWLF